MMANYREAQNLADTAALVGANDLLAGKTTTTASTDACAYVTGTGGNSLPANNVLTLTPSIYFSPSLHSGPHVIDRGQLRPGRCRNFPKPFHFLLLCSPESANSRSVTAQAVAGGAGPVSAGVIALSPSWNRYRRQCEARHLGVGWASPRKLRGTGTTNGTAGIFMSGTAIIQAGAVDTTRGNAGVHATRSSAKIENPSGATATAQTASPSPGHLNLCRPRTPPMASPTARART